MLVTVNSRFNLRVLLVVVLLSVCAEAQQPSPFQLPHWSAEKATFVPDAALPDNPPVSTDSGCGQATIRQIGGDARYYGNGLRRLPRAVVSESNLKWEVPVVASTIVLIEAVDTHVAHQFQPNSSTTTAADDASNALLGAQIGSAAITYLIGCKKGHEHTRHAGLAALEAAGYGAAADGLLKLAFNREYPTTHGGEGQFWHGGKSFPSGHAATSWAIASALAHEYPDKRWVKWTAYGAATGITVLRLVALKHFPSDVVIGGTIGYVTGTYLGSR
jgi:hypothetical protein